MTDEAVLVARFNEINERASLCGLTIKTNVDCFEVNIPKRDGKIYYKTLDSLEIFVFGYEMGCGWKKRQDVSELMK